MSIHKLIINQIQANHQSNTSHATSHAPVKYKSNTNQIQTYYITLYIQIIIKYNNLDLFNILIHPIFYMEIIGENEAYKMLTESKKKSRKRNSRKGNSRKGNSDYNLT